MVLATNVHSCQHISVNGVEGFEVSCKTADFRTVPTCIIHGIVEVCKDRLNSFVKRIGCFKMIIRTLQLQLVSSIEGRQVFGNFSKLLIVIFRLFLSCSKCFKCFWKRVNKHRQVDQQKNLRCHSHADKLVTNFVRCR